jgi:hypothetical protein
MFYPKLYEVKGLNKNRVGYIRDKLVKNFPEKYIVHHSKNTRIINKPGVILTIDELVEDFKTVVTDVNDPINVDINSIQILSPDEDPYAKFDTSSRYSSIKFKLDGVYVGLVYADSNYAKKTTRTTTHFKEGLVIFFIKNYEKYKDINKSKEEYTNLIQSLIDDIQTNNIEGVDTQEVDSIITQLLTNVSEFNEKIFSGILNAMSIGIKLGNTPYSEWTVYRDKEFFTKIKNDAATNLGFSKKEVDKWCPMDFILVKPGAENKILSVWAEAKDLETEEFKIGRYNSVFVDTDKIDILDDSKLILAISLKEHNSQAGWGKGYLSKTQKVKDDYDLTKEELQWTTDKFLEEIVTQRKKVNTILSGLKEGKYYIYEMENPINGFKKIESAKIKYASLKLLNYLLSKTSVDNIFINSLLTYSMGLGKNPPFFVLTGNKEGDAEKIHINKREQKGAVELCHILYKNKPGKILIKDSNNATGIEIRYSAKVCGELNKIYAYIRKPGTKSSNVSISINKSKKMDESTKSFYPRLNEKFEEESDPIADMKIGIAHRIEEYIDENDDGDVRNGFLTKLQFIVASDLDNETRKVWTEYLLKDGDEDVNSWEETDVIEMDNIGVKIFPNLSQLPFENISYKYKDGKYFLYAKDWADFSDFFQSNNEMNKKTAEQILSGEGYEIFDSVGYGTNLKDILSWLNEKEAKQVFNILKPACEEELEEAKEATNLSHLFYLIEKKRELDAIHSDILRVVSNLLVFSAESEAFKDLQRAIEKQYKMTFVKDENAEILTFNIAEKGLYDLFLANWEEDKRIYFYPPQYGWQGELDFKTFIEDLQENL